ncbi:cytidine deaminase-like protein [Coniella lustricola]|uniref:Deoxycytidylate deaminase n=1 Tax=Coniella lustricola TaxID=2025994 RepID=A0A2T2ZTR3_9PEZI|nr:cytidine deaminase-like protein [Coniella lustricola]
MLIGICGSICSGRSTVARYLVDHHGFTHVFIQQPATLSSQTNGDSNDNGKDNDIRHQQLAAMASPNTHHKRTPSALTFASADDLLEHVTQRWRDRWVLTDVLSKDALDAYSRRPFFLLVSVDAPLLVRWDRYRRVTATATPTHPATTLAAFAALSDTQLYHPVTGQATHLLPSSSTPVRLLNTSTSLASLYANLASLDLLSPDRLRPSWDTYFMSLASLAAHRSNCMKRRVGCVVVSPTSRRVISTGYNGTPRGIRNCSDGGCPRCNSGLGSGHGLATCLCIHAEENALLEAGRDRLREGAVLYCDTCPCLTCSIKIAQVGVSEVVYAMGYSMDRETAAVFREAGVKLRQFVPPANGLIHLEKMELNI